MENASKALLMAAAVLIGILIISLAVYLFVNFGAASAEVHKQNAQNRLTEFNTQFTAYESKEHITIYDVISVANLATENNIQYGYEKGMLDDNNSYVMVYLKNISVNQSIEFGVKNSQKNIKDTYNKIIQDDINNMKHSQDEQQNELTQYDCNVKISPITRSSK